MTDEVRADLEVTTKELRADQHELLMWSWAATAATAPLEGGEYY